MAGARWSCAMVVGAAGQLSDSLWDSPGTSIATRSRMNTYWQLTGHKRPRHHYRHMSPLQRQCDVLAPWKGGTLSAILRGASLSVASMATIAMVFAIGPAPTASATPCGAPDANIDPPPPQEIPVP